MRKKALRKNPLGSAGSAYGSLFNSLLELKLIILELNLKLLN